MLTALLIWRETKEAVGNACLPYCPPIGGTVVFDGRTWKVAEIVLVHAEHYMGRQPKYPVQLVVTGGEPIQAFVVPLDTQTEFC